MRLLAEAIGKLPQALQEKPEYTPIIGLFLEAFAMLNATRVEKRRFTLSEIERCAKIVGEGDDLITFTRLMIKLDMAYTKEAAEKQQPTT